MTRWKSGDPVGSGVAYLPDAVSRKAYGDACEASMIDAAARYILGLPSLDQRREFIERVPQARREAVKARVSVLWGERP